MQTRQELDDDILRGLQSLSLDPPELLFNPTVAQDWLRATFDNVPRYLFRVYTPKSRGRTDTVWTRSMDATDGTPNSKVDIFARNRPKEVAGMLSRHLWWREGPEDNFVSWTNSLLFAIVYLFHLHANTSHGSAFDDISLCIVDTTRFTKGVFLRDLDLIRVFRTYDEELQKLGNLRSKTQRGSFYFGEYLSQGALKIEDKCQIVSAQAMIDQGLYVLQPEFERFAAWQKRPRPPWAKPVLQLREEFYRPPEERQEISIQEEQAAMSIAQIFGRRWRLPVAAKLVALRPRRSWDSRILVAFRSPSFTDEERSDFSPLRTRTAASSTLPEVQQYADLQHEVYQDLPLAQIKDRTSEAEGQLRTALILAMNMKRGTPRGDAFTLTPTNPQYAALQRQLHRITVLTRLISEELAAVGTGAEVTE